MRYRCALHFPQARANEGVAHMGFACDTIDDVVEMCTRVANGLQCNGGAVSLTVLDREEGAAITVQRRSCHGFGNMVSAALQAFEVPPVPTGMGEDARMVILGGKI